MSDFLFWALAVTGSALVLTQSVLLKSTREWIDRRADIHESALALALLLDTRPPLTNRAFAPLFRLAARLVTCPMCSGFWFGASWYLALRESIPWTSARAILHDIAAIVAFGFAGSIASAIGIALWLLLDEARTALSLWRYNNLPKDPQ